MIKEIIKSIYKLLPLQNIIMFESNPDFSDNTMPVFEELLRRGYNKTYKFVWLCKDTHKNRNKIKNVFYVNREKHPFIFLSILYASKMVLCCNHYTGTEKKGQHNFYLCHGTPLKDMSSYYSAPKCINHVIASSEYMVPILANQLKLSEDIIQPLGFPRNDILLKEKIHLRPIFGDYDKFIVWYPTVKTFKGGRKTGCIQPIQFIGKKEYAQQINDTLVKNNILLIIKPHFAQMTEEIKICHFSNIQFIDDSFFEKHGITSYEMIGACDALLTDYSSIYSDYLLCDKPIGLIWEDIDDYLKNPGLIKEYEFVCSGGVKIYTCSELCSFLDDVKEGKDVLQKQRKELLPYIHCSELPDNTKRVTDYIVKVLHSSDNVE